MKLSKKVLIIGAIIIVAVLLLYVGYAAIIGGTHIDASGTGSNQQKLLTIYLDETEYVNGSAFNLGTLEVGDNTYNATVVNNHTSLVQAFMYVTNPYPELTIAWNINGTALQADQTAKGVLTVTASDQLVDGQTYTIHLLFTVEA